MLQSLRFKITAGAVLSLVLILGTLSYFQYQRFFDYVSLRSECAAQSRRGGDFIARLGHHPTSAVQTHRNRIMQRLIYIPAPN